MSIIKQTIGGVMIAIIVASGTTIVVNQNHYRQVANQNATVASSKKQQLLNWQAKLTVWNEQAAAAKQAELAAQQSMAAQQAQAQTEAQAQAGSDLPDTGAGQNTMLMLAIMVVIVVTLIYSLTAALRA